MSNTPVWVTSPRLGGKTPIYHTDETCQFVGDKHVERTLDSLLDDYQHCQVCDGTITTNVADREQSLKDLITNGIVNPDADLAPDDDDQLVWVTPHGGRGPSNPRKYHTKDDCPHLTDAHVQKPLRVIHSDLGLCNHCDDSYTRPPTTGRRSLVSLINSGEIDPSASPSSSSDD